MTETPFEPKIVGFLCNWCSYRAADLAGTARIKYATNVRIIRVMCSGRVDPSFVLKALAWAPTACWSPAAIRASATTSNRTTRPCGGSPTSSTRSGKLGLEDNRVRLVWASAAEGQQLADAIDQFVDDVRALGPLGWPELGTRTASGWRPWRASSRNTQEALEVQA